MHEIKLISPRLRGNPDIEFIEDDIIQESPPFFKHQFDVVRAANVLNKGYFADDKIEKALGTIRERLSGPGSFPLICQTKSDGTNHGSLFRLADDKRFVSLIRIGTGSSIEPLVLGLPGDVCRASS